MKLTSKIDSNKLAIIGLFGIMAYNAFPYIGAVTAESAEGQIETADIPKLSYIDKGKTLISANNYAAVKTLYKLQSVMDDLNSIPLTDFNSASNTASIRNVFNEIEPYLSDGKLNILRLFTNNFDTAKQAIGQITGLKTQLSALPESASRGDRFKLILNELPAISGIPGIEKYNELKNMIAMLKPLAAAKMAADHASDSETKSESDRAEYNDLLEVVKLIEDKKDGK